MDIKITVINMFRKIDYKIEHFDIELETIRKNHIGILELKIIIDKIKKSIEEVFTATVLQLMRGLMK